MSDSTPPRPKPGSLRDRIAAFEQKPAANPVPAPAPRPKPGGLSKWTPKPAEPPSPTPSAPVRSHEGGMSASDAKSSIGQGGSLKERMAALQGLGAFGGAPAPAEKPRPPTEKPKWKPPPQVQISPPIGDDGEETAPKPFVPPVHAPGEQIAPQPALTGEDVQEEDVHPEAEGEEGELDPDEEERQRRAAIAARMARLGGARVGMGPPVFGKKPTPPPKKPSMDESKPAEEKRAEDQPAEEAPSVQVSMDETPSTEAQPNASTDNLSLASNASSPPTSMPVPAAPKRAGPPRRKTATKSPSPAPQVDEPVLAPPIPATEPVLADEAIHKSPEPVDETVRSVSEAQLAKEDGELSGDAQKEIGGVGESVDEVKDDAPEPAQERRLSSSSDLRPESPVTPPDVKPIAAPEPVSAIPSITRLPDPEPAAQFDEPAEAPVVEHEKQASTAQEEEDDDEETRRKRVAERVAKMGGFNPFSGPPPPAPASPEQEEIESPAMPQRKASMASVDSTPALQRQESAGSVYSPSIPERKDFASFAMPQHEELDEDARPPMPERKESLKVVPQRQGSVHVTSPTQLSVPEPPPLTRKDSSSSVRSYTVTQIGGGKASDDEKGEEGPDLPDRSQVEDPAQGTEYMVSEMGHDSMTSPAQPDNDEGRDRDGGYVRREDSTRVRHEDAGIDTGISQGGDEAEERVVLGGDGDDEAVEDGAHFVSDHLSPESAPIPPNTTTEVTNDEPPAPADEDEDEMAPPRPTRSLPVPPPPAPTPDMSTRPPASPPSSSPPPPAKRVSMPPVPRAAPVPASMNVAPEEMHLPHPPSKRTSFPPSSRAVPVPYATESPHVKASSQEQDDIASSPGSRRTSMQPPARPVPSSHPTSPPRFSTKRTSVPPPSRAVPVPVPAEDKIMHEEPLAQEPEEIVDEPAMEEARPPPPPRKPSLPTSMHSPAMSVSSGSPRSSRDIRRSIDSPRMFTLPPPPPVPVTIAPAELEQEILDESDGDPIDPRFHSPSMSSQSPPVPSSPPHPERELASVTETPKHTAPPAHTAAEEDEDKARRRTIADRMAKLGGIKFGAPPGAPPPFRRPQPPPPPPGEDAPAGDGEASEAPAPAPVERAQEYQEEGEEEEHARRARIAAKLAGMGGMRFGMLPVQPTAHESPRPAPRHESEERPSHPVPSHPVESDYEFEQQSASSDGVKVEEEESEMEEVHHADAEYQEESEGEEAVPPPPPRPSTRPPIPLGRPPVPPPVRKGTIEAHPHSHPHIRGESYETLTASPARPPMPPPPPSHSEYVMVDDVGDAPPPLPRSRPPPRGAPPPRMASHPPAPPAAEDNSTNGQWEIPSVDFGDNGGTSDLSTSLWSEDSTAYPSTEDPAAPPPTQSHSQSQSQTEKSRAPPTVPKEMSAEQLRAVWGRVGVQMCEAATALHERSKRTLVGNGSYAGFVGAVLAQVPNALRPASAGSTEYGYLVYAQTGASVRARVDEILPGDVVVLEEARLKGHKGLHAYTLNVGDPGVPGIGVVTEFEAKKVKIKALQANQHVGQATVESVSYKLEDLKSGTIKVYRVLEA